MKRVECWRWRYRDPETGRICRTMFVLSPDEAADLPEAERIPATMTVRFVEEMDFADTMPDVGCHQLE